MDGNPVVFFEDLFDIGATGKRYSHLPTSTTDLPVRPDIVNIIQSHQKLQFKNGDYAVPTSLTGSQAPFYQKGGSGDHLVLERKGKAIIGITDKYNTASDNSQDEEVWVSVGDASWNNTDLYDYSGAHGVTATHVYSDGRVLIKTAPAGHTISGARGHGYSIWAPKPAGVTFSTVTDMYNYIATYAPGRAESSINEWEMADDLGDSHPQSLQQGGKLPNNSTAQRIVGRIYAASSKTITYKVYPEVNGRTQNIAVYNTSGTIVSQVTGTSSNTTPLTGTYTPSSTGWYTIKVKNSTTADLGQKVWVNVTYTAPTSVNTRTSPGNLRGGSTTSDDPGNFSEPYLTKVTMQVYPNPAREQVKLVFNNVNTSEQVSIKLFCADGTQLFELKGATGNIQSNFNRRFKSLTAGLYFVEATTTGMKERVKLVKM
jgi:alpha-amylase